MSVADGFLCVLGDIILRPEAPMLPGGTETSARATLNMWLITDLLMKTERQCYANTRPSPNGALGALIKKSFNQTGRQTKHLEPGWKCCLNSVICRLKKQTGTLKAWYSESWHVKRRSEVLRVSLTSPGSSDPAPASPIVFSLGESGPISDSLRWIFMSPRFKPLSEFVLLHCITPGTFHGHKLHFLMNGNRKNRLGLNWDPSFTEIIGGKQQKRDEGNRQKRWQWLRFQKVLIALPQEKPFSWSLDPRVNKCHLPPCLTDTTPCTVYILQVTHSMTATVRPHPSPDLWVIHTWTRSAAIPPVHISVQYRLTKTARDSHRHDWRTQVCWLSVFLRAFQTAPARGGT